MMDAVDPMFPPVAHIVADLDEIEAEEAARLATCEPAPAGAALGGGAPAR